MKFLEILQKYQVPYKTEGHHHCRFGWVQVDCCWCSRGWQHWRLGYSLSRGTLNCWACGFHPLLPTLAELTGESLSILLSLVEGPYHDSGSTPKRKTLSPPVGLSELTVAHASYLRKRGFDPEEISAVWGVKGIGIAPKYQWTLYIPLVQGGKILSFLCRRIVDREPRYLTATTGVSKKEILYGEDLCKHSCVVSEGPLDAWRIGPGGVATMGLSYSQQQVLRISRFPLRVICFDSEEVAQRRARKLCEQLSLFPGETVNVCLETGKDASRANKSEIVEIRKRFLS